MNKDTNEIDQLKSAIAHCTDVQNTCTNIQCSNDHKQLAIWLTELLNYKEKNVQIYEYVLPMYLYNYLMNNCDNDLTGEQLYFIDKFLADRNLDKPVKCSLEPYYSNYTDLNEINPDENDLIVYKFTFVQAGRFNHKDV